MNYFKYFPITAYGFGSEALPDLFRDLSAYVSVVDEIKQNVSFYNKYYIQEFERPDQVSNKLYGTPNYHWTFWLMNDNLRERGWPLTNRDINEKILKDYPLDTLITESFLLDKMRVGQTVTGQSSGATGVINRRRLDLGQLILSEVNGEFIQGEPVVSINSSGTTETIIVYQYMKEYNAPHHYVDAEGSCLCALNISGSFSPSSEHTPLTHTDRYFAFNEELKTINVIKPENIIEIVNAYREALRT